MTLPGDYYSAPTEPIGLNTPPWWRSVPWSGSVGRPDSRITVSIGTNKYLLMLVACGDDVMESAVTDEESSLVILSSIRSVRTVEGGCSYLFTSYLTVPGWEYRQRVLYMMC